MGEARQIAVLKGWRGDARAYTLTPPLSGYSVVIVSAAAATYTGPETYIFGARGSAEDDGWEVADWTELEGSYRGGLDHAEALSDAGYEIVNN